MGNPMDYKAENAASALAPDDAQNLIVDAVDVARALGVHPRTVQRWILSGKLKGHRMGGIRSRWRVRLRDCERAYWADPTRGTGQMIKAMARCGAQFWLEHGDSADLTPREATQENSR